MRNRDIHNCLLYSPRILEPMDCSFPDKKECGKRVHIVRIDGRRVGIYLCKWRIREIGWNRCIEEQKSLLKK